MNRGESEKWDRVLDVADMTGGQLSQRGLPFEARDHLLWDAVVDFMADFMRQAADELQDQVRAQRGAK